MIAHLFVLLLSPGKMITFIVPLLFFASSFLVDAVLVPITYLASFNSTGAVCLDGSAPAYHLLPGASSSWHISLEGGGWCETAASCARRAKGHWGSSTYMQSPIGFGGSLSSDAQVNPDFYDWTQVFVRYCDGASFTADVEEPLNLPSGEVLFFRGKRIFEAIIDDLKSKGLSAATQVLLSGCSAGGLSTILHCNDLQSLLDPGVTVKCLSDAGFFINIPDVNGNYVMAELYLNVVSVHQLQRTLESSCISDFKGDALKCFFPEVIKEYVKPPLFLLNAAYDSWQLDHGLNISRESYNSCITYSSCPLQNLLQTFRDNMVDALSNGSKSLSYFVNSCFTHCQALWDTTWTVPKINGKSAAQAVGDWYFDRVAEPEQAMDCPYPCNPTCTQQA